MGTVSLHAVWDKCVNRLKDKINSRSFWEAIEATKAVAVDGDNLIIGLELEKVNYIGVINQGAYQHTIGITIREVFGREFTLRVIEGITLADWKTAKDRDTKLAERRATAAAQPQAVRPETTTYSADWEGIYENITTIFQQTPNRNLPQGKARFASEALYALAQAMGTLYPDTPDDATERSLSRVLERISLSADMPVVMIAFELDRLRAYLKVQSS